MIKFTTMFFNIIYITFFDFLQRKKTLFQTIINFMKINSKKYVLLSIHNPTVNLNYKIKLSFRAVDINKEKSDINSNCYD